MYFKISHPDYQYILYRIIRSKPSIRLFRRGVIFSRKRGVSILRQLSVGTDAFGSNGLNAGLFNAKRVAKGLLG